MYEQEVKYRAQRGARAMKRALIISLVGVGCLALGACFIAYVRARAFHHNIIEVHNDSLFSQAMQQKIETACRSTFNTHDPFTWIQIMRDKYTLIADISCSKQDYGVVVITITSKPLRFSVDDSIVMDSQGNYHDIRLIDKEYLKQLPAIVTHKKIKVHASTLATFARSAPSWLLHKYAIVWQSKFNLWLRDHRTKTLLRARADQLPTQATLMAAQHLLGHTISKRTLLYADARFNNQIVIARYKGDLGGEGDVESFFRANSRID